MKVFWTPDAQQERFHTWEHLPSENPDAAVRRDSLMGGGSAPFCSPLKKFSELRLPTPFDSLSLPGEWVP